MLLVENGAVAPLLTLIQSSNVDLVRAVAWALSILSRDQHDAFQAPWSQVVEAMYQLMYRFADEQILVNACNVCFVVLP